MVSKPLGHFTPSQYPSIHHDDEFPPFEQEQQAMSSADDNYQSHDDMQQEQQAIASPDANSQSKVEVTPTSTPNKARIGCRCKTVSCEKISCKCFKNTGGCSDRCRCEKCKNWFGTREDYIQAMLGSMNDINERLGIGKLMELNTHVPSHTPPLQSSIENVTPSSQISASNYSMPDLVTGTRKRRSLEKEFMQETSMPDANSVYQSGENMGHLQHPGVVPFGSVQSHGRYRQRLQIDMIQDGPAQSAASRDPRHMRLDSILAGLMQSVAVDPQHMRLDSILACFRQSNARDPQRMQSTLNRPNEPLSDHMNMPRPSANSVSQFGENMGQLHHPGVGHSGSAQRHGRYPQRLQIDMIQAGPVQSAASRDPRHMRLDSILAGIRRSSARDPQRVQSGLNHPHEPLSDHRDEYMNTSRPHAFGSVQPHGRYSPRPRLDFVQDGSVSSNARDPQRMQSTLNHPYEPLSDHRDMSMNTSRPHTNSVSQFGENMGHLQHPGVVPFGSVQPPQRLQTDLIQAGSKQPDAGDPQRMMLVSIQAGSGQDLIQAGSKQPDAGDPQRMMLVSIQAGSGQSEHVSVSQITGMGT